MNGYNIVYSENPGFMEDRSLKKQRKKHSVIPIYVVAATWLVLAFVLPMYKLWALLVCLAASIAAGSMAAKLLSPKAEPSPEPSPEPQPEQKSEPESPYSEDVRAIIKEGALAQKEMGRLYASIKSPEIRGKINRIMQISDKIVLDAKHDPSDVPQIKKFLSYYLPTTIKLLNAYDRMGSQGIEGSNISGTMKNIEEMLDTTIWAYEKQLDSLFANQALDIDTDIQVLNAMLAREGLADDSKSRSRPGTPNTGYSSPFGSASPFADK